MRYICIAWAGTMFTVGRVYQLQDNGFFIDNNNYGYQVNNRTHPNNFRNLTPLEEVL